MDSTVVLGLKLLAIAFGVAFACYVLTRWRGEDGPYSDVLGEEQSFDLPGEDE